MSRANFVQSLFFYKNINSSPTKNQQNAERQAQRRNHVLQRIQPTGQQQACSNDPHAGATPAVPDPCSSTLKLMVACRSTGMVPVLPSCAEIRPRSRSLPSIGAMLTSLVLIWSKACALLAILMMLAAPAFAQTAFLSPEHTIQTPV